MSSEKVRWSLKRIVRAIQRRAQRIFPGLKRPPKIDPNSPFGNAPIADRATYLELHKNACERDFPSIRTFLERFDYSIDDCWLQQLALHTQICIKHSPLNFQHGYILYSLVRNLAENTDKYVNITILETGTARGFSALCMARALIDAGGTGSVVTLDIIPHNKPIYWNCIDDNDGQKTRQSLLLPWQQELEKIIFIQGESNITLDTLGLFRVQFAFLDACHTEKEVMFEFNYVAKHQQSGDVIFFDDVTEGVFDGVVAALKQIELIGDYSVEYLASEENRGYAIATRL